MCTTNFVAGQIYGDTYPGYFKQTTGTMRTRQNSKETDYNIW